MEELRNLRPTALVEPGRRQLAGPRDLGTQASSASPSGRRGEIGYDRGASVVGGISLMPFAGRQLASAADAGTSRAGSKKTLLGDTVTSTTNSASNILSGGGEMGALMRSTDWSSTSLGPVEHWPQSLRTAVSILLDSKFGMYIAWGPQYAQLYNDPYRPILGSTKHPQALGNLAEVTFAESWSIIGPMFEDVRRGNAVGSDDWMLPLERHGYLEECFFTFSYSPIRDESGGVGGVHVTVTETTERVLSARRLRALHRLSEACFGRRSVEEACLAAAVSLAAARADVPFALLYLVSSEGDVAHLAGCFGLEAGSKGAPIQLQAVAKAGDSLAESSWPIARVLRGGGLVTVNDVAARFGSVPSSTWPEDVRSAVLLPIMQRDEGARHGVLIAGLSPRRALDSSYEEFFALVASHVATAISGAQALEDERRVVETERERLYTHFLQAPFAVAVFRGENLVVEFANPVALSVWGKTQALVGGPLLQGFPELVGQPFVELLKGVLRTGIPYEGKGALARLPRGPGGSQTNIYFNFVYSPLRGRDGAVEGVLVAGFEVTAEVGARRELEEAQWLLRSVIDNVPELAWTARPDGHIDFYNQRWYDYTGTTPEQMEGWGWRSVHDAAMQPSVEANWFGSLATGKPFEMEFPLRAADGSFHWFLCRARALKDAEGKIVRWFGTNTNIDERVQLLASEKAAREEAERSNRAKDEFLAIVSHELRNPLNAMLGWTRLLRSGSLPEAQQMRALETVERNAVNQAQLIDDLLDVARIVSGKLPLDVQSVHLARIVEAALDSARPALDAKALELSVVLDREATLFGDPARLQQVVWNLLTNAIKFTPRGGSLRVVLRRDDAYLELAVCDNGSGIDPSFIPYVFDRFKQADPSSTRSQGGLGLGLAITKSLVEMHGGTISVESTGLGQGATFVVRLPVAAVRGSHRDTTTAPRALAEPEKLRLDPPKELLGLRVLAVDDEPDAREIVAVILGSCGVRVTTAGSVAEAMAAFEQEPPDVVLTDIGMPGEDGYSLISKLRALPKGRGGATPVACLTGYAGSDDRRRALLAGFNMHIPKPVDPEELIAVTANLARMAKALRSSRA